MNQLEYILSGTAYTRIHSMAADPGHTAFATQAFRCIKEQTNHKFGLLYNAFTEKNFAKSMKMFGVDSVHADSGGLQIVTQGLTATPETKDSVYENQAAYADLGMCFDEIPVKTAGAVSARNDVLARFFDMDGLEQAARQTGRNLVRQIEVYQNAKSTCKPILIAQGNCYDTYMRWTDWLLEEIPDDMKPSIGGVAMGAAALGTGPLEDVERAFIYSKLNIEKTHLHVLGVGAIRRILPYLIFIKTGLYENATVSYDSTSHSSGIELGSYYSNIGLKKFTRSYSYVHDLIYADALPIAGVDLSEKEFLRILNTGRKKYSEIGGDETTFFKVRLSAIVAGVINFCKDVDKLLESKKALQGYLAGNTTLTPLNSLFDVETIDQYNKWKASAGRYLKTSRIRSAAPGSLEDFF